MQETARRRGRPRKFDRDDAIRTGVRLFHQHGYERVGLAMLTEAIGIAPPSFYAAFGSKAAFFELALREYTRTVLPLDDILRPGRPALEAVRALLLGAASVYSVDPDVRGCFIIEHSRVGSDDEWRLQASSELSDNRQRLRAFLVEAGACAADLTTDFIASTMSGMSADAREGWGEARLTAVAEIALKAVDELLRASPTDA